MDEVKLCRDHVVPGRNLLPSSGSPEVTWGPSALGVLGLGQDETWLPLDLLVWGKGPSRPSAFLQETLLWFLGCGTHESVFMACHLLTFKVFYTVFALCLKERGDSWSPRAA